MNQDEKITIQPENQETPANEYELHEKELEKVSGGLRAAPTVAAADFDPGKGTFLKAPPALH